MITQTLVETLKARFEAYVQSVASPDAAVQQNLELKRDHTRRVCREIRMLSAALRLDPAQTHLAEVMALFHDIGRFEQYVRYQTFVDRESVNHADLGVEILQEQRLLDELDLPTQQLILKAIAYHNRAALPENETERCLFFAKLLRDADKLDIWRVVIDYYHNHNGRRNNAIELGLPDTPGVSEAVCSDLLARRIVDFRRLRNLNDFKLLQVGWIYDIYFTPTLRAIQERAYLEHLRTLLPATKKLEKIFESIYHDLERRMQQPSSENNVGERR